MMVGFYVVSALGADHALSMQVVTLSVWRLTADTIELSGDKAALGRVQCGGRRQFSARRRHRRRAESRRHMTEARRSAPSGRLFRRRHLGRARGDGRAARPRGVVIRDPDGSLIDEWPYERLKHLNRARPHLPRRIAQERRAGAARDRGSGHGACRSISPAPISTAPAPAPARNGARPSCCELRGRGVAVAGRVLRHSRRSPTGSRRCCRRRSRQRLGNAADTQVRAMFDKGPKDRPFECGGAAVEAAGQDGLRQADGPAGEGRQRQHPDPVPSVVRREEANAVTLPGGHIYVFEGLIDKAENVDEVAGVIAHELGHAANRDGIRDPAPGGRAVAGFRQPSRRFRRRRRRGIGRRIAAEIGLFAPQGSRRRRLSRSAPCRR